jgi:Fe2+ transport system protein FeoA
MNHTAIYALYPQVVTVDDGAGVFDVEGNQVEINLAAVEAKALELKAEAETAKQAKIDARQSALNKLMALGLTEEEALALGVTE